MKCGYHTLCAWKKCKGYSLYQKRVIYIWTFLKLHLRSCLTSVDLHCFDICFLVDDNGTVFFKCLSVPCVVRVSSLTRPRTRKFRLSFISFGWLYLNDILETVMTTARKHAHAINRDFLALKTQNFQLKKFDIFLIFAQNRLWVYVRTASPLTSTHNLCFGAKIRKICITLHTPVLLYKSGVQGGIHYKDMFS